MPEGSDVQQQQVLHVLMRLSGQDGCLNQSMYVKGGGRVRCRDGGKEAHGLSKSKQTRQAAGHGQPYCIWVQTVGQGQAGKGKVAWAHACTAAP